MKNNSHRVSRFNPTKWAVDYGVAKPVAKFEGANVFLGLWIQLLHNAFKLGREKSLPRMHDKALVTWVFSRGMKSIYCAKELEFKC